ncbi:MAG: type 4a pilus biogenesis protein PilO [PVC group bacterium]|nr:type 4a pilus biogenesis protein PilO [PVC group bacterium]
MNLTRREILLSFIYLIVVIGIALYFFFYKFLFIRHNKVNTQITSVENALTKMNSIMASKSIVEKEYSVFEKKLSSEKVKQTASTEILQDIKTKAAQAGLNVINIKPFLLKKEGLYGAFDFKLETEGTLKNIGQFLYNLDDSPYLFTIKYLQMNARTQGEHLQVQLMLSAILAKE